MSIVQVNTEYKNHSHNNQVEFPIVKDTTPNITNSRLNNIP